MFNQNISMISNSETKFEWTKKNSLVIKDKILENESYFICLEPVMILDDEYDHLYSYFLILKNNILEFLVEEKHLNKIISEKFLMFNEGINILFSNPKYALKFQKLIQIIIKNCPMQRINQ